MFVHNVLESIFLDIGEAWDKHLRALRSYLVHDSHRKKVCPTFEQKRLAFVQSTKVAAWFDSGRARGLFIGSMIRHIIMESVFDALKRAVTSLTASSVDTTLYGGSIPPEVQGVQSDSDLLVAHNSFFGWACLSLMQLCSRRSKAVSELSESKMKWDQRFKIVKSFRTLRHELQPEGSLAVVDDITQHRNKGGLFLPPVALLPFTTLARKLIKKHVNGTQIYDGVLIDAAEAVNSNPELMTIWNTWYRTFNPSDEVHGLEICRALLSKLINSEFGVVLKKVNARFTSLGKHKQMQLTLREDLKASSNNSGGVGGGNTQALRPFHDVIAGPTSVGVGEAATGRGAAAGGGAVDDGEQPWDLEVEEGLDVEALLEKYEQQLYGEDEEGITLLTAAEDVAAEAEEEVDEEVEVWLELATNPRTDEVLSLPAV